MFSMFVNEFENEWGELTYVPTFAGKLLLVFVVIFLLIIAVMIAQRTRDRNISAGTDADKAKSVKKAKLTTIQLSFCAMALALGTVLSNIKIFRFPTGGAITLLSMLVIALPGYFFGVVPGIITGVAYGVLQLIIDPYVLFPAQLVIDYILAFGALGLSGLFHDKKNGLLKGYIAAILGRYVFAVLSGWIFFGSYAWEGWAALPYSLVYNAIYIFAEAAVTIIVILVPVVNRSIGNIKKMANQQ